MDTFNQCLLMRLLARASDRNQLKNYTQVSAALYLFNDFLEDNFNISTGYDFSSFNIIRGPYDPGLQREIAVLCFLYLLGDDYEKYEHKLRVTELGHDFGIRLAEEYLRKRLGKNLEKIEIFWLELTRKSEAELIRESTSLWMKKHPEKAKKIRKIYEND